jgi:hypothetical protein
MAIYSLNHRTIGRSTHAAGTAGAHVGYITRASACRAVIAEHIPEARPGSKGGPARAWLDAQELADRKNARVVDKLMLALPLELDQTQRVELVRAFVRELAGGQAVPFFAAFHDKAGTKDGDRNPHAHLVIRDRDPATGKGRVIGMSEKGSTDRARETWERICNRALETAGCAARIDRRSLKAQQAAKLEQAAEVRTEAPALADALTAEATTLARKPTGHHGPAARQIEDKGRKSVKLTRIRRQTAEPRRPADLLPGRLSRALGIPERPSHPTPEDTRRATEARRAAERAHEQARRQEAIQRAHRAAQEATERRRQDEATRRAAEREKAAREAERALQAQRAAEQAAAATDALRHEVVAAAERARDRRPMPGAVDTAIGYLRTIRRQDGVIGQLGRGLRQIAVQMMDSPLAAAFATRLARRNLIPWQVDRPEPRWRDDKPELAADDLIDPKSRDRLIAALDQIRLTPMPVIRAKAEADVAWAAAASEHDPTPELCSRAEIEAEDRERQRAREARRSAEQARKEPSQQAQPPRPGPQPDPEPPAPRPPYRGSSFSP